MANSRNRTMATIAATVAITAAAIYALMHTVAAVTLDDVLAAMAAVPPHRIALALVATIACYAALSGYDRIALRSLGKPLDRRTTLMGSTAAYALSHNLGFAAVTATYARHRVYSPHGVGIADVARIVVLTGTAFWIGVLLALGLCLLAIPGAGIGAMTGLSRPLQIALGLAVIDVMVLYLLIISRGVRRIGRGAWSVPLPTLPDAVRQTAISLAEMALAGLVLWLLVPDATASTYPTVVAAYVVAFVAVLATHAPGGAGVLETIVILMMPGADKAGLLAALILFRLVFHVVPLVVAVAILVPRRRR